MSYQRIRDLNNDNVLFIHFIKVLIVWWAALYMHIDLPLTFTLMSNQLIHIFITYNERSAVFV